MVRADDSSDATTQKWSDIVKAVTDGFGLVAQTVSAKLTEINEAISRGLTDLVGAVNEKMGAAIKAADSLNGIADLINSLGSTISGKLNDAISAANSIKVPTQAASTSTPASYRTPSFAPPPTRIAAPTAAVFRTSQPAAPAPSTYTTGSIHLTVNPAPGMNERALAEMVIRTINEKVRQERLAYGL